ncbi:MAG TPA: hypothetical protein VIY86_11810, partial [Pirellulaceae bacterium]
MTPRSSPHDPSPTAPAAAEEFPAGFLERLARIVPSEEYDRCVRSFREPKETSFRISRFRADPDQVWQTLDQAGLRYARVDWHGAVATVSSVDRDRLLKLPLAPAAMIYVQSLSSMLAAHLVDARPGEQVLDLAAA